MADQIVSLPNETGTRRAHENLPDRGDDWVLSGCNFVADFGTSTLKVKYGELLIADSGTLYWVKRGTTTGLSFGAGTSSVYYVVDTSGTSPTGSVQVGGSPSQPYLELGTVDASGQTTSTSNRDPTYSVTNTERVIFGDGTEQTTAGQGGLPFDSDKSALSNGTDLRSLTWDTVRVGGHYMPDPDNPDHWDWKQQFGPFYSLADDSQHNAWTVNVESGSETSKSASGGALTFSNGTGATSFVLYGMRASLGQPFHTTYARVESFSGTVGDGTTLSDPVIGFRDPGATKEVIRGDVSSNTWNHFTDTSGASGGSVPTPPFDLQLWTYPNKFVLFTSAAGENNWTKQLESTHGEGLHETSTLDNRVVCFGHETADGESVSYSRFSNGYNAGVGMRDFHLVRRKDGAPLMDGSKIYLSGTGGGPSFEENVGAIWSYDVHSNELEWTANLFNETDSGQSSTSVFNDITVDVVYDDDTGEFIVAFGGWAERIYGDQAGSITDTFIGRTSNYILDGTHRVTTQHSNLPRDNSSDDVYDTSIVYDESAGAWRTVHTMNTGTLVMSETTDDTLTSGWSELYRTTTGSNIEGGKIVKVNGEYNITFANDSAAQNMTVADYPDFSNPADLTVPFDPIRKSHPQVAPIPDNGSTRYLLFGFDSQESFSFGNGSSGAMCVWGANETADGYEWDSVPRFR